MKSIKTYLIQLILIAFFSTSAFSQSNNSTDERQSEITKIDSVLVNGYFTESDYNKKHNVKKQSKTTELEIYYKDENKNKDARDGGEKDGFLKAVAAEVIVEVVVNTLFIIAAIWR
jgi:hypothetical protein